jgi:anti-sigma regulatory factor (Ser/Thr protein kinase)
MWTLPARLIVNNDLSELDRVSSWLRSWAERYHVPPPTAERLDLCSAEVLTNIVSYGYPDGGTHHISLGLGVRGGLVALEIQDDARPFDPSSAATPERKLSLEEAPVRGWGIPMVRHFSDELHYRRLEGRNLLLLIFRLSDLAPIDDSSNHVPE